MEVNRGQIAKRKLKEEQTCIGKISQQHKKAVS
jgi:hypothetical protein